MPKAVVCNGVNERLEVQELTLEEPRSGEVRVEIAASAVCHSDLLVHDGTLQSPFPMVLGHEGAGTVAAVGPDVEGLAVGDHVVVATMPQCGECVACRNDERHLCERVGGVMTNGSLLDGSFRWTNAAGEPVRQQAGVGAFAEEAVIPALSAVKIDPAIPLRSAAMAGCRLITGMGSALNVAAIEAGASVAVIGCGGVGLSVIQGARIAGAAEIVAIDLREEKLELAREVGATTAILGDAEDLVDQVRALTPRRGVDVAFDVVGIQQTFDQASRLTRRGGEVIVVGVPSPGAKFEVRPYMGILAASVTIKGAWLGWSNVKRDIPRFLGHYQSGELQLDELTTSTFVVEDINDAFESLRQGEVACAVIEYA